MSQYLALYRRFPTFGEATKSQDQHCLRNNGNEQTNLDVHLNNSSFAIKPKRKFTPRLKVWKLTHPQRRNHFQEVFKLHVSASVGVPDAATEDI